MPVLGASGRAFNTDVIARVRGTWQQSHHKLIEFQKTLFERVAFFVELIQISNVVITYLSLQIQILKT
jgi:hypothetical protein